jgi:hypothetical protein
MIKNRDLIILYISLLVAVAVPQASAFWGVGTKAIAAISKSAKVLPEGEIKNLSQLSDEIQGTKKVGQELAKLKLPDDVLEDTLIRIAIHQNKISRDAAEKMFLSLTGIPGFRSALRKVIGNSKVGTAGHLNELEIAAAASSRGFIVLEIGKKFNDGLKKAPTDIDLLLKKDGRVFAIEAKNYASSTMLPMDKYRGDLDTLKKYMEANGGHIIPIFTITNKPNDMMYLKRLRYEADKRGVQLIFGEPASQIEQIKMLGDIL